MSRDPEATDPPAAERPPAITNLLRDLGWQIVGSVLSSGISLATTLIAVRLLGREGYGGFGLVQTAALWCCSVLLFGGGTSVLLLAGRQRHRAKGVVLGAVVLYLGLLVTSTVLLTWWNPPGETSFAFQSVPAEGAPLIVLHAGVNGSFLLFAAVQWGADRYRTANLLNVAQTSSLLLGLLLGAWLGGDFLAALWGAGLAQLTVVLAVAVTAIREWGFELPAAREFIAHGGSVGLRSYVVRAGEMAAETFGIFYLSHVGDLAGVAAVVGCARVATFLARPAWLVRDLLMGKVAGVESGRDVAARSLQLARLSFLFGAAGCVVLLPLADAVTVLSLGEEFRDATAVLVLFLLSEAFRSHASPGVGLLIGQGCQWPYVILKIIVLVATVIGVLMLAPEHGARGVAFVQAAMSAVMTVVIGALLVAQAGSLRAAFFGDDLAALRQVFARLRQRLGR